MTRIAPLTTDKNHQSLGLEIGRAGVGRATVRVAHDLLETASLYLHIPFCHTRCHYCDFNTYAGILPLREPYVRALLTEIELAGKMAQHNDGTHRRSRTIFFGGGSPSLLTVSQITRLLQTCYK